jgi:alpha-beta hydrolase superfamily lysophospholipase
MHMFFPDSYMLSQAVMRILYTGGEPGEALAAVDELHAAPPERRIALWPRVWRDRAIDCFERAASASDAGHTQTARGLFLRSCTYFQWAAAFGGEVEGEGPRELHRNSRMAFTKFADLTEPRIEAVSVPYESARFPAWFVPASDAHSAKESPVAVYLPGWDSTKEQGFQLAEELAVRGISTLLCDGPGIGEALYELGLPNRFDYEVPVRAAVDHVLSRHDVAPSGVFIVGSSLGGYRAARACAFEKRVAAVAIWGAMWDFHEVWLRGRQRGGAAPTRDEHALRAMGVDSIDEVTSALEAWKLEGVAERIDCPILVLHGESDQQVPAVQAKQLFESVSSSDKTLRLYSADELGSSHCQNDHREIAHTDIADWLLDKWRSIRQPQEAT